MNLIAIANSSWEYSPSEDNISNFLLRRKVDDGAIIMVTERSGKLGFKVYGEELEINRDLIAMIEVFVLFHKEIINIYKIIMKKQADSKEDIIQIATTKNIAAQFLEAIRLSEDNEFYKTDSPLLPLIFMYMSPEMLYNFSKNR